MINLMTLSKLFILKTWRREWDSNPAQLVELLPNLYARLRGSPARFEELLHGRSHTILIAGAPISIPVAKTRIPAAPVTCERICGLT